ncbi:MAG: hypothetical protein JSS75_07140 [Bacteroidetes bacterium]|nr:hypothetical protein [Bacteroidota bacterium]
MALTYPQIFLDSLAFTLKWEGGWSNDPKDPGGATMKGITQEVYSTWRFHQNLPEQSVRQITDDELRAIYYASYWIASRCDQLPDKLATALFDFAANCGVGAAVRSLQNLVDVDADGILGPKSIVAVNNEIDEFGQNMLVASLLRARSAHYAQLCTRNRGLERFLDGWLNRVKDLQTLLLGESKS